MQLPDKYKKILGFLYILIGALLEFSETENKQTISNEIDEQKNKGEL